jgi:uncharacterized protein (TIGR00255 family)
MTDPLGAESDGPNLGRPDARALPAAKTPGAPRPAGSTSTAPAVRSMTAFARTESQEDWGSLAWELRSVNHRFLEPTFRLPEDLRDLEGVLRERIARFVQRGKLECRLRFQPAATAAHEVAINTDFARQLAHLSREVDALLYSAAPINAMDVLRWPGVLLVSEPQLDVVRERALSLFEAALADLVAARVREGIRLQEFIELRLQAIHDWVTTVKARLPEVLSHIRDRLSQRLAELKAEVDAARLEQEIALLAQKMDVAEELDRLDAHVDETRRDLMQGGSLGRKLDFLMQEMHREANTLAAKSADIETTRAAVELKVLIEQVREQVQNLE